MKIATLLFLLIYSLPFARAPFSWAARHTTVCLDIIEKSPGWAHYVAIDEIQTYSPCFNSKKFFYLSLYMYSYIYGWLKGHWLTQL